MNQRTARTDRGVARGAALRRAVNVTQNAARRGRPELQRRRLCAYQRCQDGAADPSAEAPLHRRVVGDQLQTHALRKEERAYGRKQTAQETGRDQAFAQPKLPSAS